MHSVPPRSSLYCAAFAILALSSVGLLWHGPADTAGSASSVAAEYRKEALDLKLAPGWHWPTTLPFTNNSGYGKGAGTARADEYWFCTWARRALSRSLGLGTRRQALEQLPKLRGTYAYAHYIPDTRSSMDAMINNALRGNTSELNANCSWLGSAR